MSMIVIMPGGFHPFHAGHFALYQSAKKAFPNADLYVAATNDQSERPFPFALKEKLAKLAGVDPGRFIQVKSPFQAKEITQNYNPEQDVLVFVRSEKDRNEPPKPGGTKKDGSPAYFQPYTGKNLKPFSQHAYMAYLPTVEFGPGITSATQIRKAWPTLNDKRKTALVMSLYPAAQKNPKLAQTVVGMFDQVMGGQVEEGWKQKAGAAALAGAMATGASGVVLNPARPIGAATATRPAPTVANPNPAAHSLSPLNPSSPTYVAKAKVVNIHGKEYLRHELPQDMSKVTKTTDDAGNEIYAWTEKSGMRPQYTYRWFAPVQTVKEQDVAEGFSDIVKGVKRKVAGKTDPKEVEHMYGRIARSAIKHKTPDQAEKDIQRYNRVAKVVNKEGALNEFAPGNGDDGLPYAEYVVYQCDPKDQFDFIGGPLYQTDNLGMAHKYAYEMFLKHRPKAFVVYQPHKEASRGNYGVKGESDEEKLDEGLGDYITKKIDDFLDTPKISPQQVSRLMKQAPSNLPDDVAEKLVAKFMETEKAKRLAQQAADANKTTVEKIVPYLTYFGRAFVDRWKQIPQRDRDNALKNLVHNIGRFLLFILEVLAKGLMKKEGVEESKSKAIANTVKDLKNPPEIMKRRAMRDQEREETYKNAQLGRDDLDSEEDVELQQLMRKAQQHYPNMPNKQQAFIKFVQRALKHSEEEDTQQDKEIADLKQEVDKLKQDHKKIMKVSESLDYIEEK